MRLSEMYTLTVDQVQLPKRTISMSKTKNGDGRQLPLSTVATRLLAARLEGKAGGMVFPWFDPRAADPVAERRRITTRRSMQFPHFALEKASSGLGASSPIGEV